MTRRLAELSGPEAARRLTAESTLVLPVGAVEHHGEHLPLATDLVMAEELAGRIVESAAAAGHDAWVLPALGYTKSDEHAWAPGTMWLTAETLHAVLIDLGRSISATPARTVLFYNGHGGNVGPLATTLRELRRRFGLRTFVEGVRVDASADEAGFGIHGGDGETSLLLHLRPELVRMQLARRSVPEQLSSFRRIGFAGAPVQFGWLSDDFGFGGVIGDPTRATAQRGEALAARLVAEGVATIDEIARWPIGSRDGDGDERIDP